MKKGRLGIEPAFFISIGDEYLATLVARHPSLVTHHCSYRCTFTVTVVEWLKPPGAEPEIVTVYGPVMWLLALRHAV
jgi:hypothetical protein